MFSQRSAVPPESNQLSQAVAARRAVGLPVLDLTESNPTRTTLAVSPAELCAWLEHDANARYEPEPFGLPLARKAVARHHGVTAERVVLAASTSEAYGWLFQLLCEPGDAVLVPAPSYPLFEHLARLQGVELRTYASRFVGGEWQIDQTDLLATPRLRAVLLVTPNNPTGAAVQAAEVEALTAFCCHHGLALISDEVFADTLPAELAHGRVRTLAHEQRCLTFVLSGLSKLALLPQLKCGWLLANGPPLLVDEALRRLEVIADTCLSVATPVQNALPRLLEEVPRLQRGVRARLLANRQLLGSALVGSLASLLPADGGWSAIVRMPRIWSDEQWAHRLLADHGVLVQPGWLYDLPEGHLVLSVLPDPEVFARGVAALLRLLATPSLEK